jgi:cysteine desulfurase / selenocysteine lyase
MAREAGAAILIDGAQASIHAQLDMQALDCDFYVFSGHKALGPTGIGVLYGRAALLEEMPPYQGGGDMIKVVSFSGTTYNDIPYKFEAGTPHIAGAIGLASALEYFRALDFAALERHENALLAAATTRAMAVPGLRIVGTAPDKVAVLSFTLGSIHPQDIGTLLDHHGVAIRTGHHCAMPVMARFGVAGTARISFAFYNTLEEVDGIFTALERVRPMLD